MDGERKTMLFREVNERIDEMLRRFEAEEAARFLCECPSWRCSRRVVLTRQQFEEIWSRGELVVAPGCRAERQLRVATTS